MTAKDAMHLVVFPKPWAIQGFVFSDSNRKMFGGNEISNAHMRKM